MHSFKLSTFGFIEFRVDRIACISMAFAVYEFLDDFFSGELERKKRKDVKIKSDFDY